MNEKQQTKTCGWCQAVMVDGAAELRATIRRQAETIKALQRALCEAQSEAADWRGRCLAAEMQWHKTQWWEG